MRRYSIMYFISQSFKGLWRNGVMTLASIIVLMSCLVVTGSFALLVANINTNLDSLGDLNEIVTFIDMELDEAQILELKEEVEAYENVKTLKYVSKEDAFLEEKAKYEAEYPDFFEGVELGDVYPASFVITYENNSSVETLKYELEHTEGIYKVNCRSDVAETIETMKSGIVWVCVWFLIILFVVSIFVIINTIKLAVEGRKQEISVMRYVGATNWFIMIPFVLEGILIGLFASGIAFGAQYYIYDFVNNIVANDYGMFTLIPMKDIQMYLLGGFLGIGVLTGVIGTSISLRKNLKA